MAEKALAKIRKFKLTDISKILEIEEQAFPKTAYSRDTMLHYANSFRDNFFVIEAGSEILGYIIFDISGHVHSTAVKSAYRRKGFGRMLFMHALRHTKKRLWLEVRSKNSVAIRFYKGLGMETVRRIPHYYGTDDALIMVLGQEEWARYADI
jgi:ribosomal-protein-alanine N-acetyltransferase